jgi:protease-4
VHRPLLVTLAVLALATSARAAPTPELPLPLFGNESVTSTDGASGFLLNPAAGGLHYPGELLLALTDFEPNGRLYRAAYAHGGVGVAASIPRDGTRAWTFGMRGGDDRLRMGLAFTRLREDGGDGRATDYKMGMLSRPVPWLSIGGLADHLFQPSYLGERLGRVYTAGIGIRPIAWLREQAYARGPDVTLTADVMLAEATTPKQARVRFGAQVEVGPGIIVRGAVQDHGGFQVGLGLLGTRMGYHAAGTWDQDQEHRAPTHAVSLHRGEDRTVLAAGMGRVASVPLAGVLADEPLSRFTLLGGAEGTRAVGPIHRQLERALEDPLTRGVLLELRGVANMAQLEELRPRIARLRRAGKPVVAYLEDGGGRGDLYLAAACDRIVASEEAFFMALGLRAERRYYRSLLADWGLRIDRSAYGAYKSAWRGYSADSTPAADRETIERNLDVTQELFVSTVAADRRMDRARLLTVIDGRRWSSRDLVEAGLIDSVGYREDALRMLGRLARLGDRPRTVNLARVPAVERAWTVPQPVAVVYASGAIAPGRSGNDLLMGATMGAQTVTHQLERAFRAPGVRAVVLRVESPGGSGIASNLIDHAVQRLKRETRKPVIVSMGSVAGSGGYYISAHGDRIFADRHTRTGSIGVVSLKPSLEGWYEKHRVHQDDFDRGPYMRGLSTARDWDRTMQASADSATYDYYRGFVSKVAEGRRLEWAQVDSVARGRVWMGEDAVQHRLVDEIGGLEAAIAEARRRAGVPAGERIRLVEQRRPRPWFLPRMAQSALASVWASSVRLPEPGAYFYLADGEVGD